MDRTNRNSPLDTSTDSSDVTGRNERLLGRRSCLKALGATSLAVGTAMSGLGSVTAAEDDYELIEVGPNDTFTKNLSEGETWGNVLIDITASGAEYQIHTQGNSCTIRNVGVRGAWDAGNKEPFIAYTTDPNGEVLVENIYLGDGSTANSYPNGHSGVFVPPSHAGTLTVRNLNYQNNPSNGVYGSAPGNPSEHPSSGAGGDVIVEDSYAANHASSGFRVGTDDSRVENCVAVGGNRGGWAFYNNPTFVDCDFSDAEIADLFSGNGSWSDKGVATVENCRFDTTGGNVNGSSAGSPQRTSPEEVDGVPLSPEEAASGTANSGAGSGNENSADGSEDSESDLENLLLFDGDASDVTRYEFEVSGEVAPSNHEGASIDDETETSDGFGHGVVADWKDAFRFSGELEQLTVDGPATVYLNDEEVTPSDYGEELPHVLEVEGQGTPTSFEITVDGTIELASDEEPEEEATTISGSTVQSAVTDSTQTFRFSGAVTDVNFIEGEAVVSVDGEEIDPSEYGEYELLPNALVVDGTDAGETSEYSFEITGSVVKSDFRDASIDEEDAIEGSAVRGAVGNWLDAYWFDGDIEDFHLVGDASVDVQYNVRDQ